MTHELERELDDTMAGLDEYIRAYNRTTRLTKSVRDDLADEREEEQEGPEQFEPTVSGLRQYVESAEMQRLKESDPDEFARRIHAFIDGGELVKSHVLKAEQVAQLAHYLSALPRRASRRCVMTKAARHPDPSPEPWNYEPNERGLNQFLHSAPMKDLERTRPALWRKHHEDFFAKMVPAPLPHEVSRRRMALELLCPDDPTHSPVAKAVLQASRLTTGQRVHVQNFGAEFDPAVYAAQW